MKNTLRLFAVCMLLLVNAYSQTSDNNTNVSAVKYLEEVFTPGKHQVEILEKDISEDLRKIIVNYRRAISDDMDWYSKYSQEHAGQDPLPYHKNFGISTQEYDKMNAEFASAKMKVKTVKTLNINKASGQIQFSGDNGFSLFDPVVIDLENNALIIDERQIPYTGEVKEKMAGGDNLWTGHRWLLEEGSMEDVKAFKQVNYTMIDLSISKATDSEKAIITFKTIYVEEGRPVVNGSVTAYLN